MVVIVVTLIGNCNNCGTINYDDGADTDSDGVCRDCLCANPASSDHCAGRDRAGSVHGVFLSCCMHRAGTARR